jgi:DNA-binding NarL/FixJ family response regulator
MQGQPSGSFLGQAARCRHGNDGPDRGRSPHIRSFAKDLLESEGFEVIGQAENGASAIEATRSVRPDLVLLDVQLPDISGFEVLERLRANGLPSAVVLTSSRDASSYGDQVASSGAVGFIPKAELSGQAVRALLQETSRCKHT